MTITRSNFRILVIAEFSLGIIGGIVDALGESSLPLELQSYLNHYYESDFSIGTLILFGFSLFAIVSNIGILFFAKWAKDIFAGSYLLACAGMFLGGPVVQTGLAASFIELSIFCAGFIVACMYFSPAKDFFEKIR